MFNRFRQFVFYLILAAFVFSACGNKSTNPQVGNKSTLYGVNNPVGCKNINLNENHLWRVLCEFTHRYYN